MKSAVDLVVNPASGTYEPPWLDAGFMKDVGDAATVLDSRQREHLPVGWFTARAGSLGQLAVGKDDTAAVKADAARMRQRLMDDATAMATMPKLKEAVTLLSGGHRPAIHVLAAAFGDVNAGSGSARVCDATRAIQTRCQRLTSCKLDAGFKTSLCGFDPVPAADDRIKAVTVYYACFAGGDGVWDALARRPAREPGSGALLTEQHPSVSRAVLRETTAELRCPSEPASAGGSGQ